MVGTTISHYQILEKLGEGGMGVVYKARDRHLDRFVAIKVLTPGRVSDPERKRRFVQEAKAASALNHPNIIAIYDIWSDAGDDFIAMEYVAGKTLDQLIPRKGMELSETLKIAIQIAGALAAAHRAGIVHRDVKPANIMVNHEGFVKILDFGLAKLRDPTAPGDTDSTKTIGPNTQKGVVVGTIAYMSPEQAEGKPVDARSDIFSFGAVLYELLSGRRAFQRETTGATLAAVLACEPPPIEETPPEVSRMVSRMLAKKRESRYQSAEQLLADLDRIAQPQHRFLPRRLWFVQKHRWLCAAVLVLAAALVAGVVWSGRGSDAVFPPGPAMAALPVTEDLRRAQEYLQRYDRKGNIDAAVAVLLPALRRNPSSAGLHACLSEAYRRKYIKTFDKEWLQKAIESGQRAVAANDFLEAGHIALGMALFENGQKEAAAKQFERAHARNPLSGPAHLGLAKLSSGSDAEQLYLEAVQYSGDWITLLESAEM